MLQPKFTYCFTLGWETFQFKLEATTWCSQQNHSVGLLLQPDGSFHLQWPQPSLGFHLCPLVWVSPRPLCQYDLYFLSVFFMLSSRCCHVYVSLCFLVYFESLFLCSLCLVLLFHVISVTFPCSLWLVLLFHITLCGVITLICFSFSSSFRVCI